MARLQALVDYIFQEMIRLLAERGFVGNHLNGGTIRGEIPLSALPVHDIITKHSATGLTPGDVLTATGAAAFAFQAPTATVHNILSVVHSDTDETDVPVEGDHLVYRSGEWVAEAAIAIAEFLFDDDAGLLVDDDGELLTQDAA